MSGTLYFAYGSNMSSARMRSRVPDARLRGVGCVAGFRLAFEKLGVDGTGKANLVPEPDGIVWGVLWALPGSAWPILDGFEPGYARRGIEAVCEGLRVPAQTYVATHRADARLAVSAEYARLVLEGAREHGLPAEHVARIGSLAAALR